MAAGGFKCERGDCSKVSGQPCPKCGMPEVGNQELEIIRLFQRCKEYKVLPYSGGVLEQPAWILSCFDTIEETQREYERKKELDAQREAVRQEQKEKLYV